MIVLAEEGSSHPVIIAYITIQVDWIAIKVWTESLSSHTCVMIENGGHVFFGKSVVCIAHQQTSFPNGAVTDNYAFQHDRASPVCHDTRRITIFSGWMPPSAVGRNLCRSAVTSVPLAVDTAGMMWVKMPSPLYSPSLKLARVASLCLCEVRDAIHTPDTTGDERPHWTFSAQVIPSATSRVSVCLQPSGTFWRPTFGAFPPAPSLTSTQSPDSGACTSWLATEAG